MGAVRLEPVGQVIALVHIGSVLRSIVHLQAPSHAAAGRVCSVTWLYDVPGSLGVTGRGPRARGGATHRQCRCHIAPVARVIEVTAQIPLS
jgi:hypothetical protein